jgi:hypothetical protein
MESGPAHRSHAVRFGLYEGYVKNTNVLDEQILQPVQNGAPAAGFPRRTT